MPYAELLGYGATSDAHHMVQPRADGSEAARAATIALDDAGVEPGEIDYVNAHASSTPIGDVAEARAIALALGERAATVPVSGTKALYGHPLGASGAIEAAICALAIRDGWAPASVNLARARTRVAEASCRACSGRVATGTYERVLSTSFGFGGLNAALVFGASTAEVAPGRRGRAVGARGERRSARARPRDHDTAGRGRSRMRRPGIANAPRRPQTHGADRPRPR